MKQYDVLVLEKIMKCFWEKGNFMLSPKMQGNIICQTMTCFFKSLCTKPHYYIELLDSKALAKERYFVMTINSTFKSHHSQ